MFAHHIKPSSQQATSYLESNWGANDCFDYRRLQTSSLDTLVRKISFRHVFSLISKSLLHTPSFQATPQEFHRFPREWVVRVRRLQPSLTLERESKTDSMGRNNQFAKAEQKIE
jgi:hypothetical protein